MIDFIIACFALVVLSPIFILLCILIKKEDKGPIFYNAERLKKNGDLFKMYKFRSMKYNSPDLRNEDGSTFNSEHDSRLTKIGKVIRKTSLDEIPQLLNVIKGDMSLVGPRPDLPDALSIYTKDQKKKLSVKPGITGFSQAYFRNSIDMNKKIENDIYYVNHISWSFDLKIIIKTIQGLISKKSIYNERKVI